MGIENLQNIAGRLKDDQQKQVLEMLKDGKISDNDAKKMGLTKAEQEYLNSAFSSTKEVQLGDYVIYNKGDDSRDPNYQLTQSATRKRFELPTSTNGYYGIYETIQESGESKRKFFNGNNEPISEKDFFANANAEYNPKAVYYIDKDGKMQSYVLELSKDKLSGGQTDLKQEALLAVLAVVAPESIIARAAAGVLAGLGITLIASSCTPDHDIYEVGQGTTINVDVDAQSVVNMPLSLKLDTSGLKAYLEQVLNQMINENRTYNQAILDALQTIIANQIKQGTTLEAILNAIGNNDKILEMILKALMQGNQLLQDVRGLMEHNNKQNDEILKVTLQILEKLNGIEKAIADLVAKFPGLRAQLDAILNAIKNNQSGATDPAAILAMLDEVVRLLKNIDKSTAATEETTRKILAAIQKLGADQAANFAALIDAINNNYGGHGPDYTNLLNLILAKLDKIDQTNQNGYEALLDKMDEILKAIKDHHVTIDVTGTVTCNCNCGNHEGILNDIDGLIH